MADFLTVWKGYSGDWQLIGPGLAEDDGLITSVIISLFTDRRAEEDDALPDGSDRRGWWGDIYSDLEGDRIGSRLWLLAREKQLPEVLVKAREYAVEALQWLIDDGVAAAVKVETEIVRQGVLGFAVEIVRHNRPPVRYRFEQFWKGN
jgi:phage gp46-like protein